MVFSLAMKFVYADATSFLHFGFYLRSLQKNDLNFATLVLNSISKSDSYYFVFNKGEKNTGKNPFVSF